MIYPEERQEAARLASEALARMAEHHIAPEPANFTLWYGYCSERPPGLKGDLDSLLGQQGELSSAQCHEIYERHFGSTDGLAAVQEATQRIREALDRMRSRLDEAGDDSAGYSRFLAQLFQELDLGAPNLDRGGADLSQAIAAVVSRTEQILERHSGLERRLKTARGEIDELQQRLTLVTRESTSDALTGIANRKYFDARLALETRAAENGGEPLCLLLADVDHFKRFNDTYGHRIGDQALKTVARLLQNVVKGRDLAARYGGEEFAVVLPRTDLEGALTVAEQIRESLACRELTDRRSGRSFGRVTLSLGAARFRPGESLTAFINRADEALYAAKRDGRDQVKSERALQAASAA